MLNIDWNNTKSYFSPETLLQDFNTLFLLNMDKSNTISIDNPMTGGKDQATALEKYQNQVEFSPEAYTSSTSKLLSSRGVIGQYDEEDD